jgi:dTDP-4-dehydrorhamnose reductase
VHPDWIVLTAAYTDVDGSEQNSELAFGVNGEGMKNVACVAQEDGAKVFYVRRDYLFDGNHPIEPKRPIAPLNVYGRSKAAGEKAIQENHSAWCIARTSWLFGASGAFPREDLTRFGDTSGIDRGGGSIRFTDLHPRSCRRDPRPGPYGWARNFACHQHRILFLLRVCT